jgi:radical SAM/Cys-rich protein
VEEASKLGRRIMDRCNLTVILANKSYHDLPEFFARHKVEVVSSLPHYTATRTDRQRGEGVFDKSIKALQMLNEVGYGKADTGLKLNLVYNPTGAILPGPQQELQADYKRELNAKYGIEFNDLYVITNMPISRFLDYLVTSGNYEDYMQKLIEAFNPAAAAGVMCRNTLSVGWDGYLYDCDFNQMLDMKVTGESKHISEFDFEGLSGRDIAVNQHCYGCTAGLGSSCGGQMT